MTSGLVVHYLLVLRTRSRNWPMVFHSCSIFPSVPNRCGLPSLELRLLALNASFRWVIRIHWRLLENTLQTARHGLRPFQTCSVKQAFVDLVWFGNLALEQFGALRRLSHAHLRDICVTLTLERCRSQGLPDLRKYPVSQQEAMWKDARMEVDLNLTSLNWGDCCNLLEDSIRKTHASKTVSEKRQQQLKLDFVRGLRWERWCIRPQKYGRRSLDAWLT